MKFLAYVFVIGAIVDLCSGKCYWKGRNGEAFVASENGSTWDQYQETSFVKRFDYVQHIYPGDEAVILHKMGRLPLVIDRHYAFNNGEKFARGGWSMHGSDPEGAWVGERYAGGAVRFVRNGQNWAEYNDNTYVEMFRHVQRVSEHVSAVILEEQGGRPLVLTSEIVYSDGREILSRGNWDPTCKWTGTRNDGHGATFQRISPTQWNEYKDEQYLKTFEHVQQIGLGAKAAVLQQIMARGLWPVVVTRDSASYRGRTFAEGSWAPYVEMRDWKGTYSDGQGTCRIITRGGDIWYEYKNGRRIKYFQHIQSISEDRVANVLQQPNFEALVVDDTSAYYKGNRFASGFWDAGLDLPSCETQYGPRKKRDLSDEQLCEFRNDNGNQIRTILRARPYIRLTTPPSDQLNLCFRVIGLLQQDELTGEQRTVHLLDGNGNEVPVDERGRGGVRLDIQGVVNWGNQRYINIQVQSNETPIRMYAQVLCPVSSHFNAPYIRDVRRALLLSLDGTVIITLQHQSTR